MATDLIGKATSLCFVGTIDCSLILAKRSFPVCITLRPKLQYLTVNSNM